MRTKEFRPIQRAFLNPSPSAFGGTDRRSNPRRARPFAANTPIHLILRTSQNMPSLHRHGRAIESFARNLAKNLGAKIISMANVGNHLHLIIVAKSRPTMHAFMRGFSGTVARIALGAAKTRKRLREEKTFWRSRPFTRIADWGRGLAVLKNYLRLNKIEFATGFARTDARALIRKIEDLKKQVLRGSLAGFYIHGLPGA
jgi:REP element-mobilizing transposase RayT